MNRIYPQRASAVSTCVTVREVTVSFNLLNTGFLLNTIYKFGPYLRGNTLRHRYKAQPVNALITY
jgi:hypothetical protein